MSAETKTDRLIGGEAVVEYCRETLPEADWRPESGGDRCQGRAEFILWGKLIPKDGLGPRCYEHAAKHVGHDALRPDSGWAVFDLRGLRRVPRGSCP